MPAGRIRHVKIIKNVGVLAEAEAVVPLIGESVDVIKVAVVPKANAAVNARASSAARAAKLYLFFIVVKAAARYPR